jgi:hypothetical protein
MSIDKKILEEIARFNNINNYILEQEDPNMIPPADPNAMPPADPNMMPPADPNAMPPADPNAAPPADPNAAPAPPTPIDVEADKDVEVIGDDENEELEITDLVDSQKSIGEKQDEYFDNLFAQIKGLEEKLSAMDQLVSKIDNLETNIEKMRPKTSQEKLELRSLDSGPFNQKLSDFFTDKQEDFEKTGKEYVLTTDDVEQYSGNQIKDSFNDYEDNEEDTEEDTEMM